MCAGYGGRELRGTGRRGTETMGDDEHSGACDLLYGAGHG